MRQLVVLLSLLFVLAACQNTPAENPADGQTAAEIIQWNRDAYHIVFRAEIVGGEDADAIYRLNEVPPCTIYGDGRLVWLQGAGGTGLTQVLFDYLNDDLLTNFIWVMAIEGKIYDYGEGFPRELPSSQVPVYEKLTVEVNGRKHVTDGFAQWPDRYYTNILDRCQTTAQTPRIFEPKAGWLSVQAVPYNPNVPAVVWDATAAGLSMNDISGAQEKRWIEGNNVRALWRVLRENSPDIQFNENEVYYQIALQIPGVTIDSPPAPAQ
jgi:hypothetical protein